MPELWYSAWRTGAGTDNRASNTGTETRDPNKNYRTVVEKSGTIVACNPPGGMRAVMRRILGLQALAQGLANLLTQGGQYLQLEPGMVAKPAQIAW